MSDYKIQWNISLPPVAQYAKGHMLNIAAESLEELNEYLDALAEGDTLEKATEVAAKLTVLSGLGATVVTHDNTQSTPSGPLATVTELHTCAHDKREYKEGWKNGKKWAGWFCPVKNKADQCDVDWVRD